MAADNSRAAAVAALEARLGHLFTDRELIERALTHSSVGDGAKRVRDNERLEFVGDRVLGLLVAERLAAADPSNAEYQRDLSVSHNKLSNLAPDSGDSTNAGLPSPEGNTNA